jgi:amino acid adenylation domain-containing protein
VSETSSHLARYLELAAERFPDRPAVVLPDNSSICYGELEDTANRVAGFLRDVGVGSGDRVGLLLPKSIEAVTAIFGILKAGAAYVPVDWTAPPGRCAAILSDCDVAAVFVDPRCAASIKLLRTTGDSGPHLVWVDGGGPDSGGHTVSDATPWASVLEMPAETAGTNGSSPNDLAYILYTSGSTGIPKGVMLSHRNAMSFVDWCSSVFQPDPADRFSSHAPFHFDLSVLDLFVSLKHGASVHLVPDDLGKDPRALGPFIADHAISVWYSTPSVLGLLAQFGGLDRLDCDGPRLALFAGEVFPVRHLRTLSVLWPRSEWFNLYGPTETNVCTFAHVTTPIPPDRMEPYPIGDLCSHCRGLVLDDDGRPAGPGEEGVLHIAGASVFAGYWNRPKENASAFRDISGEQYYDTGDVVVTDPAEGLKYVGRRDRMVKRRGYRIELGEIDAALYTYADVRDVATIAQLDANGEVRIVSCIVTGESRPSIIDLKRFASERLPSYMSPDVFHFFDSLPRTSTDKIDHRAIANLLATQPHP